jgi:hypothetical protein
MAGPNFMQGYVSPYPVPATRYAPPWQYGPLTGLDSVLLWGLSRGMLKIILQIISIAPNTGPAAGGTPVVIRGSGFRTGLTLTIGGLSAIGVKVVSDSLIYATTPAHAPGVVDVSVTNPDGSLFTDIGAFTYT